MKERRVLYAEQGRVLTDGQTYGKVIFLANGVQAESFHEITDEEYENIMKLQDEKAKL